MAANVVQFLLNEIEIIAQPVVSECTACYRIVNFSVIIFPFYFGGGGGCQHLKHSASYAHADT